ncbi:helix-turn-helix transcriptional regulator [Candidatus Woesearchaeota archaeon]|nr:helix-turn-helix transcriptional regulator [Candidatus Woesearchaeota archaeon]
MTSQKLRMLVLNHLACEPNSGYGLIKSIKEATGWKPSYGSTYPLLKQLMKEGLVTQKTKGRKKIYTLTKEGGAEAKNDRDDKVALIKKLKETTSVMSHLLGMGKEESEGMMASFLEAVMTDDKTFKGLMEPSNKMKLEFFRIYKEGKLKKNKNEITKIFNEATEKLRKLK